jgi:hypothetical protein
MFYLTRPPGERKVLGRPKRCQLAPRAFLWKHSYKMLESAQLLGRHGAFLTQGRVVAVL